MAIEIERKFLVGTDVWRAAWAASGGRSLALRQFYLASRQGFSLRVRIIDDERAFLTMKTGAKRDLDAVSAKATEARRPALSRGEFEYEIPIGDAHELEAARIGLVIEKRRHLLPHGEHMIEIDVFAGPLAPLVLAEVELKAEEHNPVLPDFIGQEVTHDPAYSNARLALSKVATDPI